MEKRGQFYLIAAIIIVGLLISFITVFNYSKKEENVIVNDLENELKIESQKVLDYSFVSGDDQIRQFGKDYSFYIGSEVEIHFITGKDPNIKAYQYINRIEVDSSENLQIDNQNNKIIFTLDGTDYEFDLTSGENFYFIISQQLKGETYVATG